MHKYLLLLLGFLLHGTGALSQSSDFNRHQEEQVLHSVATSHTTKYAASSRLMQDQLTYGNAPSVVSLESFGGVGNNYVVSTALDELGNTYVLGDFTGEISLQGVTLSTNNYKSIYLAKFDAVGTLQWARVLADSEGGFSAEANAQDMQITNEGNIFVAGKCGGAGFTIDETSVAADQQFVANVSTDGTTNWVAVSAYSGPSKHPLEVATNQVFLLSGHVVSVYDTQSGDLIDEHLFEENAVILNDMAYYGGTFYLTGNFDKGIGGTTDFGGQLLESDNRYETLFVAAMTEDFQLKWVQKATHDYDGFASDGDVILANEYGVFLAGTMNGGFNLDGVSSQGLNYRYCIRMNDQGVLEWLVEPNLNQNVIGMEFQYQKVYPYSSTAISELSINSGIVSGYESLQSNEKISSFTYKNQEILLGGEFNHSSFIRSFSSFDDISFHHDWEETVTSDFGKLTFAGIESDQLGNLYMMGSFEGQVDVFGEKLSGKGGFVLKKDSSGELEWVKVIHHARMQKTPGNKLTVSPAGEVFVIGYASHEAISIDNFSLPEKEQYVFATHINTNGEVQYLVEVAESVSPDGVAVDSNGNVFVAVGSQYYNNIRMVPVHKLNAEGNKEWVVYFKSMYGAIVSVDQHDNLIVAGESYGSFLSFVSASGVESKIDLPSDQAATGLVKFDPEGEVIWNKALSIDSDATTYFGGGWPGAIETDHEGNIMLSIWYYDGSEFGDIEPPLAKDYFPESTYGFNKGIVKCNSDGEVQWVVPMLEKLYSFNYNEIDVDEEGNVYVGASALRDSVYFVTSYTGTEMEGFLHVPANLYDGYVAKVTSDGQWAWIKGYQSPAYTWLSGFEVLGENDLYVNGIINGSGISFDGQSASSSGENGFVLHLTGCEQSTVTLSELGETVCQEESLTLIAEGVVSNAAYSWSIEPSTAGTISGEGTEVVIAWNDTFEGAATITVTEENLCGELNSISKSIEVEVCILSAENAFSQSLELYPNPAAEATEVRMNLSSQSDVSIRLVDMSGRTVYETLKTALVGAFRSEVNTSALEAGMYILQVKTNEGIATKQLLKK